MLPDGSVRPRRPPLSVRVFRWAVVIAVLAAALAIAAIALWFALILIPVAIAAALVAWVALRYRLWRAGYRPQRTEIWRR